MSQQVKLNSAQQAIINSLPPELQKQVLDTYMVARDTKAAEKQAFNDSEVVEMTDKGGIMIKKAGTWRGNYYSIEGLLYILDRAEALRLFVETNRAELNRRREVADKEAAALAAVEAAAKSKSK